MYQTVRPMQYEYSVMAVCVHSEKIDYCNLRRDLDRGEFDYMTYKEIEEKYPEEYKRRGENALMYRYPGRSVRRT